MTWTVERAAKWHREKGWKAGCNFVPSNAVNELEMFQAESYDPGTIDRELQLAADIGFSTIRVFLHDLLWSQDSDAFLRRLEDFLTIADRHHMCVMFVLLDSCWTAYPKLGVQPAPIPGVHNSQWLQCPGYETVHDNAKFDLLSDYVKGVVTHFKDDSRVSSWDVWNEPNNSGYADETIIPLLAKVVDWVREVEPSQPITTGIWQNVESGEYTALQKLQLDSSDVLSFHDYSGIESFKRCVAAMKAYSPGRPVLCTEYMGRSSHSTFDPHMQHMLEEDVGAINWGLVSGKTQTIYGYWTNTIAAKAPPVEWFHDIFWEDGTPFDPKEVEFIKGVVQQAADRAEERANKPLPLPVTEPVEGQESTVKSRGCSVM